MSETLKTFAKKYYDLRNEIAKRIVDLETILDPNDEDSYLDEGQQAELAVLYSLIEDDENFIKWIERNVQELRKKIREADEIEDHLLVFDIRARQEIDREILSELFIKALETEDHF